MNNMNEQMTIGQDSVPEPLAARLRPETLDEIVGQQHLLGKGKVLRRIIEQDKVSSMIFWGPPGIGKTTIAHVIANLTKAKFINFSAVTSGIKEIRQVMQQAESARQLGQRTIVFVDEIHRFNKAQQDAFLPFVEKGSIILIGATTENPSFEVNSALLSRCKVFVLKALESMKVDEIALVETPDGYHIIKKYENTDKAYEKKENEAWFEDFATDLTKKIYYEACEPYIASIATDGALLASAKDMLRVPVNHFYY
jgi:replication-associated recombination protein RarA